MTRNSIVVVVKAPLADAFIFDAQHPRLRWYLTVPLRYGVNQFTIKYSRSWFGPLAAALPVAGELGTYYLT